MKDCSSLDEIRDEIDKLDDEVIDLLVQRSKYVKQAAKFKKNIDEIKSKDRIKKVLNRTRSRAIEKGISPIMIEEVFKSLIDQMVSFELEEFQNTKVF